jgi:DNA-binding transcriptional LysR family regulator
MDWDNVRVFLAVARGGQFVAAAKRLKLDHATVSRRIAALEETIGAKLFDRRTTGAKLTGAGEAVHQRRGADGKRVPARAG